MGELKVHNINDLTLHDIANCDFYLKSEADGVIAELKDAVKHNFEQFYDEWKFLRRHKYKRCLDKANLCESEEKRLEAIAPLYDTDKECWEYASDYWVKWRERWLELAERFKEAK